MVQQKSLQSRTRNEPLFGGGGGGGGGERPKEIPAGIFFPGRVSPHFACAGAAACYTRPWPWQPLPSLLPSSFTDGDGLTAAV